MIPVLFALAACLAVPAGSDQITARDLAAGVGLPPPEASSAVVSLAPAPGIQRIFREAELRSVAARLGWNQMPSGELCFERATAPLDPVRLLEAMRREIPDARIEILDFSHWKAPDGEMEFPASGLRKTPAGAIWNGWIRYGGKRRFQIWARVSVTVSRTSVVAVDNLPPGRPISASDLRLEERNEFPGSAAESSIVDFVGRSPKRLIAAGSPVSPSQMEPRRDVSRGDRVRVEVTSGAARLALEAEAEASGTIGQTIPVRNPDTHKTFSARIEAAGKVSVTRSGL
jgi:flagella basal body P-ring formation protein FlgA